MCFEQRSLLSFALNTCNAENPNCHASKLQVQILGSGGPELTINRASSSYLVWLNGKAIVLVDAGGGSSFRYGQSMAEWKDLKTVLFTHFHADHSGDFAAMIKASWFGERQENLPVFGPYGNNFMPSTTEFITALFGHNSGGFKYLSDFYDHKDEIASYRLIPHDIQNSKHTHEIFQDNDINIFALQVQHGPIPAFAYVIKSCNKTLVFSGDTNGIGFENLTLEKTDLFIAHNAIPENAGPIAKSLHMTPTQIGKIAQQLKVEKLILSHRMNRTLGKEFQSTENIKKYFHGTIKFADDLDKY